nr:MAG TPA: hypothetical protein [Caudoviricetes sp.]
MKQTVKALITIIGIGFTFTAIAWLVMLGLLMLNWFGGVI